MRSAPVPESDCVAEIYASGAMSHVRTQRARGHTLPSLNGTLSAPYASLVAFFTNSGIPVMGRYSLSRLAARRLSSACDALSVPFAAAGPKSAPFLRHRG